MKHKVFLEVLKMLHVQTKMSPFYLYIINLLRNHVDLYSKFCLVVI